MNLQNNKLLTNRKKANLTRTKKLANGLASNTNKTWEDFNKTLADRYDNDKKIDATTALAILLFFDRFVKLDKFYNDKTKSYLVESYNQGRKIAIGDTNKIGFEIEPVVGMQTAEIKNLQTYKIGEARYKSDMEKHIAEVRKKLEDNLDLFVLAGLSFLELKRETRRAVKISGKTAGSRSAHYITSQEANFAILDFYGQRGIETVGVVLETAGDDMVCLVCLRAYRRKRIYTIEEAYGILPFHPRCRCRFVAAQKEKEL